MTQALSPSVASGYETFSPRLAPSLTIAGSIAGVAGALGVWVRAVEVTAAGSPVRAGSITGASRAWGFIIAVVVVAAGVAATQWAARTLVRIALPIAASALSIALIVLRLRWAGSVAGSLAARAGASAGRSFTTYHAGFGWGAWLLALAAVCFALGCVAGILRALDVRQGIGT